MRRKLETKLGVYLHVENEKKYVGYVYQLEDANWRGRSCIAKPNARNPARGDVYYCCPPVDNNETAAGFLCDHYCKEYKVDDNELEFSFGDVQNSKRKLTFGNRTFKLRR